jgi:Cu(I)/Ag(I) efflux system membrane fusion protein/cobalt-zinc-cadmium efflux system membrane fusion protein
MHPEVIQDHPGNCPKCGMKLVPMDPERARTILEARGENAPESAPSKERKILYWRAPMDPTYVRDKPGKSPMGMDLVPVYEDEVAGGPTIRIDPVTEQNMGVRYEKVRLGPLEKVVRSVGTVDYDEESLGTVTTKTDGWVEKLFVDTTGWQVHQGDQLFEFYSPQLYSAQQEYLVALRDAQQAQAAKGDAFVLAENRRASARERLKYFDISDDQIKKLEQDQKVSKTLVITSQLTGIVTHKNIVEGEVLKAGSPAYKIADLSVVWVIGKVFESDLPYVRLGQEALMSLDYLPGRVYRGRVTYIYPYLDPGTREISVRMEFPNPGYDLKPGMYATLELHNRLADEAVLVPAMAVINTGQRKVAYVMREPGKFEGRQLTIGVQTGTGDVQVLSGLALGETVVVSGQFLLDSESKLREATLKMLQPGKVDTEKTFEGVSQGDKGLQALVPDGTKTPPASAPAKYVCAMPAHAGILYDEPGDCPLCGMKLVPTNPWNLTESPVAYYTCPLPEHSDVHESKPGKCPKCGMTLIPVTQEEAKRFAAIKPDQMPVALYTCPMPAHADVVSDKPGKCPKCSMDLVPTSSVPHGKEAEEHWRKEHAEPPPASSSQESATKP